MSDHQARKSPGEATIHRQSLRLYQTGTAGKEEEKTHLANRNDLVLAILVEHVNRETRRRKLSHTAVC